MKRPRSSILISRWRSVRFRAVQLNGSRQQAARIEQQKAAIGAVNCASLDEAKIGDQHAVLRDVLDAAQQIAQRGMQLFDDRNAGFASGMTDQHIDRVAIERPVNLVVQLRPFVAIALGHEHRDIFDEVRANGLQMRDDFRNIGETRLCGIDKLCRWRISLFHD